jgi:uncharacterized delta-60 repeat protein
MSNLSIRRRGARPAFAAAILAAGAFAAVALGSPGQPGSIDTGFGNQGTLAFGTGPAASIDFVSAEVVQPDGKVVLVGPTNPDLTGATKVDVIRVNPDGRLDTSFGGGTGGTLVDFGSTTGSPNVHPAAPGVALDGSSIVIVGAAQSGDVQIGVARLTAAGALDPTFNATGTTSIPTNATSQNAPNNLGVGVQPNHSVVVVGTQNTIGVAADFQVSRLTAAGQLDGSFGTGGTAITPIGSTTSTSVATAVAIQPDGRIVVAGHGTNAGTLGSLSFQVARYLSNGTLDSSFNSSGTREIEIPGDEQGGDVGAVVHALALQPDGKLVLAGGPEGGPAAGFGSIGQINAGNIALVRLGANGTLDPSFTGGGQPAGIDLVPFPGSTAATANALTIDPATGTLLISGTATISSQGQIVAVRLNPNGSLDATFGDPGMSVLTAGGAGAAALLTTVSNAVDALIGGIVGTSDKAGLVAVHLSTGSPNGSTGTTCNTATITKAAHDAVRGDVRAVGLGQAFSYRIAVAAPASCGLSNVVVSDDLPAGFAWVGPSASTATFSGPFAGALTAQKASSGLRQATVSATELPAGESLTVALPGRAVALGPQTDAAVLSATGLSALRSTPVTLHVTTLPMAGRTRVSARLVSGTASAGNGGPEAALSRLTRVDIAVRLLRRGRRNVPGCEWLNARGRFAPVRPGTGGRCDHYVWQHADGTTRWHYRFRARLRSGRYELLVRITNAGGVYDTTFSASRHDLVTFSI